MPLCISETPLTPEGWVNAYCILVYVLRGWLWREARSIQRELETTRFDFDFFERNGYLKEEFGDSKDFEDEVIDLLVPKHN